MLLLIEIFDTIAGIFVLVEVRLAHETCMGFHPIDAHYYSKGHPLPRDFNTTTARSEPPQTHHCLIFS